MSNLVLRNGWTFPVLFVRWLPNIPETKVSKTVPRCSISRVFAMSIDAINYHMVINVCNVEHPYLCERN